MSSQMPSRPEPCSTPWRVAVVASLYNPEWVNGLVSHFEAELHAISPNAQIKIHQVPGSFEIPLATEILAGSRSVDAIATFGVLLEGSTAHAMLVAQSVTGALIQTSLRYRIPVLHEILLVKDAAQAVARCLEPEINRGTEAARAAVRMLRTVEALRAPHSSTTE